MWESWEKQAAGEDGRPRAAVSQGPRQQCLTEESLNYNVSLEG